MNTTPVRDNVQFYVVSPTTGSVAAVTDAPSIGIRALEMPDYLSSHKIALRNGGAEIIYLTNDLWGESLAESATRTLSSRLAARVGREKVDVFPWTAGVAHAVELRVQLEHFEGTTDGLVLVSGRYILTPAGEGKSGQLVASFDYQGKWTKDDYASLARSMGDQLDRLAAEVLAKIEAQ
jgi:uncharacterized lipoprotein YmbA